MKKAYFYKSAHDATLDRGAADSDGPRSGGDVGGGAVSAAGGTAFSSLRRFREGDVKE